MFEEELFQLQRDGLLRSTTVMESACGPRVASGGRELIALCSNDYLGLAAHPALSAAAAGAMKRYGFGSGASRLISGTSELHEQLEHRIARFKGTEAALLFNSGYAANTGIIPAVAQEKDALFSDSLNHASIIDGCRLSKARIQVYRHRDMNDLEHLLRHAGAIRRKVIVTDGVFSMDGDIAPLPDLITLADRYGALLMVDDAHGTGVMGATGKGTAEHFGVENRISVMMGTLGKALGSFGAYVAGDKELIAYLLNKGRSLIFSTALPPAMCAASLAALDVLETEPWRKERLWKSRKHLADGLASLGISTGASETPILPVMVGSAEKAVEVALRLMEEGVFAPAVRPPAVPVNCSRIRATVMATHSDEDIDKALSVFSLLKSEGLFPHDQA